MLASIPHCTIRSILRARVICVRSFGTESCSEHTTGILVRQLRFSCSVRMLMRRLSGLHMHEYLKRYRTVAITRIERAWLGIERHICAQSQLPRAVLNQVALSSKRVCPNSVDRLKGGLGKQFILVDEFQPRERIIS